MAELTVNAITQAGVDQSDLAVSAGASGDTVNSSTGLFFYVENGDSGAHTVTVARPQATAICGNLGTLSVEDIVINIPAGESRSFTIPSGYAANGVISLSYDAVTSVSVAVFSLA